MGNIPMLTRALEMPTANCDNRSALATRSPVIPISQRHGATQSARCKACAPSILFSNTLLSLMKACPSAKSATIQIGKPVYIPALGGYLD
jgi:NAD-dependent SIR2 family protein deacetylase